MQGPDLYPDFSWSLAHYTSPSYFDPSLPFRLDLGGWTCVAPGARRRAGGSRASCASGSGGNVKDGRLSNSVLPHVRTDATLYAQEGTTLENLYVARQWRPGSQPLCASHRGLFRIDVRRALGRDPVEGRWAAGWGWGLEGNYVIQRDYDQRFGFQSYKVFTGHASAYYDFGRGYQAQVDVGRYLAGDVGATLSLDRTFANGWSVGGFFTLTDVSAADFGEGSFDKGIRFRIPLSTLLGKPSRAGLGMTIRPVQRDGGQRVTVPGAAVRAGARGAPQRAGGRMGEGLGMNRRLAGLAAAALLALTGCSGGTDAPPLQLQLLTAARASAGKVAGKLRDTEAPARPPLTRAAAGHGHGAGAGGHGGAAR